MSTPSTKCSFRIPDDVLHGAETIAEREDRKLSYIVVKALREYVTFHLIRPTRPAPKRRKR